MGDLGGVKRVPDLTGAHALPRMSGNKALTLDTWEVVVTRLEGGARTQKCKC